MTLQICLPELKDHCLHLLSGYFLSSILYVVLTFVAAGVYLNRRRMREHGHDSALVIARPTSWIPLLLAYCFAIRAVWLIFKDMKVLQTRGSDGSYKHIDIPVPWGTIDMYPLGTSIIGKVSSLLYFATFSFVIKFLADVCSRARRSEALPRYAGQAVAGRVGSRMLVQASQATSSKFMFIVISVWTFFGLFLSIIIKAFWPEAEIKHVLGVIDCVVLGLFSLLLSFGLISNWIALSKYFQRLSYPFVHQMRIQTYFFLFICLILFLARGVLFLVLAVVKSLTNESEPKISGLNKDLVFPWLLYTVPELIPALILLSLMSVRPKVETRNETTPLLAGRRFTVAMALVQDISV